MFPVLVPVVHFQVRALFAVWADAVLGPLLPHKRGVDFVYPSREVLVDEW